MDSMYLQRLRFQLQRRVRRLNSCQVSIFHSLLKQFWGYLQSDPLFAGILAKLEAESPRLDEQIQEIGDGFPVFDTEAEHDAFVFRILSHCASQPLKASPEDDIGQSITGSYKEQDNIDGFREAVLEPFYEYLDDALDQQVAVLSLLLKYKKRTEWFTREPLRARMEEVSRRAEHVLAMDLYGYLHDQGLEFSIEPASASGEIDLLSPELLLDAKVFDGESRAVPYIVKGVQQIHTYTRDFNQAVGYLIIYKTCERDLHFTFANPTSPVPFLVAGGKVIYLMVIDIHGYAASASKRGSLKPYTVSLEDIVKNVDVSVPVGRGTLQKPTAIE